MKRLLLLIIIGASLSIGATAFTIGMDEITMVILPRNMVYRVSTMMREQFPPDITEFTPPATLKTGADNQLKLSVVPGMKEQKKTPTTDQRIIQMGSGDPSDEKAQKKDTVIQSAAVMYSAGGTNWRAAQLSPDLKGPGSFSGVLSSPPAGTVLIAPRVQDSTGRVSMQASCQQASWPPSGEFWEKSCLLQSGDALQKCVDTGLPTECLFPLAPDEAPADDLPSRSGDDLDLISSRFGYDADYIYLLLGVQRRITPGSLTPISLHQYGFIVMNPRKIVPASEELLPHEGMVVRYMPLGESSPSFAPLCSVVNTIKGEPTVDTKSVQCSVEGSFVFFRLDRKAFNLTNTPDLIILAYTGILGGRDQADFSFVDISGLTAVSVKKTTATAK